MTRLTDEQALRREMVLGWLRRRRRLRGHFHRSRAYRMLIGGRR